MSDTSELPEMINAALEAIQHLFPHISIKRRGTHLFSVVLEDLTSRDNLTEGETLIWLGGFLQGVIAEKKSHQLS